MDDVAFFARVLIQENACLLRLVLGRAPSLLTVAVCSHQLLIDLPQVEFLGLAIVHVHQVV